MPALNTTTHKALVSATPNVKDAVPVDLRVLMSRLLGDMGLMQITPGNTPPSNRDVLWWHTDVKTLKRWDAVNANWFAATPNQIAMHLIRRAVLGSVTDTSLEASDLFMFWDVSLGDLKVISRNDLMTALGAVRMIATEEGIQGGGLLNANRTLKLNVNGLTGKAAPSRNDELPIYSINDSAHRKVTLGNIARLVSEMGNFLSDPRDLLRWSVMDLFARQIGNTVISANENNSSFFSLIASMGGTTDDAFSANIYKTIVDVTGPGHLHGIIGPMVGASTTSTLRITIDDEVTEIGIAGIAPGNRQVLGMLTTNWLYYKSDASLSSYRSEHILGGQYLSQGASGHLVETSGPSLHLPALFEIYKSQQVLKFHEKLKVEARVASIAGMTANGRRAGVLYRAI